MAIFTRSKPPRSVEPPAAEDEGMAAAPADPALERRIGEIGDIEWASNSIVFQSTP